jgi:hypothetical protein
MNLSGVESRFLDKAEVRSDGCLLWKGACAGAPSSPAPVLVVEGRNRTASHVAWELAGKGEVPEGFQLNHTCDNRLCVNAAHLYLGTQLQNMQDRKAREGYVTVPRGEAHAHARLTEAQVAEIRRRYVPRKVTQQQLADEFGVHRVTVGEALRGVTWNHQPEGANP